MQLNVCESPVCRNFEFSGGGHALTRTGVGASAAQVVAFTATQIPGIDDKMYPPDLAGELYPEGIPILPEEELESIIKKYQVDRFDP